MGKIRKTQGNPASLKKGEAVLRTTARILSGLTAATLLWGASAPAQNMYPSTALTGGAAEMRTEDGALLVQARQALLEGNVDLARQLVARAEAAGVGTSVDGDSPARLKQDIERLAQLTGNGASVGASNSADGKRGAILALREARKALAFGDVRTASAKSHEARSLYTGWTKTSDSPDLVDRAVQNYAKIISERESRGDTDVWKKQFAQSMMEQAEALIAWKEYNEAERLLGVAVQYQPLFTTYDGSSPARVMQKLSAARSGSTVSGSAVSSIATETKTDASVASYASSGSSENKSAIVPTSGEMTTGMMALPSPAGTASLSSESVSSPLDATAAHQSAIADRMRQTVASRVSEASRLLDTNSAEAEKILQQTLAEVSSSTTIDTATRTALVRQLEKSLDTVRMTKSVSTPKATQDEMNRQVLADVSAERKDKAETEAELKRLVDLFNEQVKQNDFDKAEVTAKRAIELYPNSVLAAQLRIMSSTLANNNLIQQTRYAKDHAIPKALAEVDAASIPFTGEKNIQFPNIGDWNDLTQRRAKKGENARNLTEAETEITQKLKAPVQVRFNGEPLSSVMTTLSSMAGVPIHIDQRGIQAEDVDVSEPVTLDTINGIRLEAALNLILDPLRLGYIVKNDVLIITSKQACQSEMYNKTYYVADLVVPIPNFAPINIGLQDALMQAQAVANMGMGSGNGMNGAGASTYGGMGNGPTSNAKMNSSTMAQLANAVGGATQPSNSLTGSGLSGGMGQGASGGNSMADFSSLIDLITATVAPESWSDNGGSGEIMEHSMNLSLVINNTDEVHQKVEELLDQLRKPQDLQVTIEVRFITLNDSFFERIGVDFDFYLNDGTTAVGVPGSSGFGQMVTGDSGSSSSSSSSSSSGTQPYGPGRDNNIALYREYGHDRSAIVGKSSDGVEAFTNDLDIPFTQGSYGLAIPSFGGYDPSAGAQMGFAILSEIEAHIFVTAAQGDTKSNVLQAPKVTLFNGQMATVYDQSQSPFVTSVQPVVGDFAAAQMPIIVVLSEGTFLTVQAVVSPDRRFVRLTVVPMFSQIDKVETFTFDGTTDVLAEDSSTGDTLKPTDTTSKKSTTQVKSSGTTVQQPTYSSVSVQTTVSVPDGGTILLGGIKRLREGRKESGVPLLSNIPYINRLFKNVGVGRETESLMMMVTPRIIIPQEEEEALLGTAETTN
ncbi:MAG: hypothetical protein PHE53_01735 [Thermoguttaceae bacterium]|nr:hypothetical protein [Thermoguttaceae bacterium]